MVFLALIWPLSEHTWRWVIGAVCAVPALLPSGRPQSAPFCSFLVFVGISRCQLYGEKVDAVWEPLLVLIVRLANTLMVLERAAGGQRIPDKGHNARHLQAATRH
jgi:hypothetical protein